MSRVLIVSNRLPVTLSSKDGVLTAHASSGGLATSMASVHGAGDSQWLGWAGPVDATPAELEAALAPLRCVPVPLTAAEVAAYYDGFCNGVLWPLSHYLLDKVRLDAHEEWRTFEAVNERFADAVARAWQPGDLVWIHDYQLALVPALVRRRCPQARIGFFLHVPFPAADVFRILPWREELLRGLLGADVVGFHTAGYAYHFAYACSQVLGLELTGDVLRDDGRPVRVAAFPIGIDARAWADRASTRPVQERAEQLKSEAQGRKLVLSVDRLDYTKGFVRRMLVLDRLLTAHPQLRERLHVVQVAVPTRENVDAYADYRKTVNELVGRVNGAHGTPTRNVVHLLYRGVEPDELSALYVAADVMLVTPLRDGMNLVAKEYVASRIDDSGVLVLSEFAGASTELHEALQVNPYDLDGAADAILNALTMPGEEQAMRMSALRRVVHQGDVASWARNFLAAVAESPVYGVVRSPDALGTELARARAAPELLVVLDYDGTLVDFATSPRAAVPDAELLELVGRLVKRPRTRVHVVSGRARESLEDFFSELPELGLHAEHGLFSRPPGGAWHARAPLPPPWLEAVRTIVADVVRRTDGALLEEKSGAIAFHFRATEPLLGLRRLAELKERLTRLDQSSSFELLDGARVLEVRQRGIHKGVVVPELLHGVAPGAAILSLGDDRTDEDLFMALPPDAITIHVGSGQSVARHRLEDVDAVRALLRQLAEGTA
ncbi:MAG: bifunctional alpha,alpha-trehalose-phosphate synthase (UDP-forming)/trehalose-phosphatase [Myxococcota bacterium]